MTHPAPYPRMLHLVGGRGTHDDVVADRRERDELLATDVEVEEKLDGANVMIWKDDGLLHAAGRAGPDSRDRAGQFGALRAWVAASSERLAPLLQAGDVLYGEWLHLTHTIAYRDLPSWFVALDLRRSDGTFLDGPERRPFLARTGLVVPPVLGLGRYTLDDLEALARRSTWSDQPGEGVVVRPVEERPPAPRVAKLVRADFQRLPDHLWRQGRPTNQLSAAGHRQ